MKKLIKILVLVLVLIMAIVIVLPFIFKDQIKESALKEVNKQVDAEVEFEDFSVSILKSFPNINAGFKNFNVIGKGEFKQDTLFSTQYFGATINITSLVAKGEMIIQTIEVKRPSINLVYTESKKGNWQIVKGSDSGASSDAPEKSSNLQFKLEQITVDDLSFAYDDRFFNVLFEMNHSDFEMSGSLVGLQTVLQMEAKVEALNLRYDSLTYFENVDLNMTSVLNADLKNMTFTLADNETFFNGFPIKLEGGMAVPPKSLSFNLKFKANDVTLVDMLELVPSVFKKSIANVSANGNMQIDGFFKGTMKGAQWPELKVDLKMLDGTLKYPDLPGAINKISLVAGIYKPQGVLDLLTVDLTEFNANFGNNPIHATASVAHLLSDPHFKLNGTGNVNLEELGDVIPLNDIDLRGKVKADVQVDGRYSSIAEERIDEFEANGKLALDDFYMQSSMLKEGLSISNASLVLNKEVLVVNNFKGKSGRSDFTMKGKVDQVLSYALGQKELLGNLDLYAHYLDLNPMLTGGYKPSTPKTEEKDTAGVKNSVVIPEKIHLNFNTSIDVLHYDQMDITKFNGGVEIKDQKLILKRTQMNLLQGQLGLNGFLLADGKNDPYFEFDVDAKRFDLPSAYRQISVVRKFLPFAAKSVGKFSSSLNMKSKLGENLKPEMGGLTAAGNFATHGVQIMDSGFYSQLKSVIKIEKLKNITVKDFIARFKIKDGNINFQPFNTAIANQPTSLGGTYNLGGNIDFRIDSNVDKSLLSNQVVSMVNLIPGSANIKKIDVGLNISGPASKPDVKVDTEKLRKQVMKQIQNSSPKELEDAARDLLKMFLK